jgi:hypothetical protein
MQRAREIADSLIAVGGPTARSQAARMNLVGPIKIWAFEVVRMERAHKMIK